MSFFFKGDLQLWCENNVDKWKSSEYTLVFIHNEEQQETGDFCLYLKSNLKNVHETHDPDVRYEIEGIFEADISDDRKKRGYWVAYKGFDD